MAADFFLKLDGVKGESTDDKHRDEIVIESFSFGEFTTTDAFKDGELDMQDFNFTTSISRASPALFLAVATGKHFKDAILTGRKVGGSQFEFLKWTLTDVVIRSWNEGGSAGSPLLPNDQFSAAFRKIEFDYTVQKEDGSMDETIHAEWELKK